MSRRTVPAVGSSVYRRLLVAGCWLLLLWLLSTSQLRAQPRVVFNVIDFGATINDTLEDTVPIQAAIEAAGAIGGAVYLPSGTYRSGSLRLPSNILVYGDPDYTTVIEAVDNIAGTADNIRYYDHLFVPQQVTDIQVRIINVTLRDLKLLGRSAAQWNNQPTPGGVTIHGISMQGTENWHVERVWAEDFDGDGIYIGRNDGLDNIATGNVIEDCVLRRNLRNGISITHGDSNTLRGCLIEENQQGILPGTPKYAPEQYQAGDVDLEPNIAQASQRATNNLIEGNVIRNSPRHGLALQREGADISGNIIRNNSFIDNAGHNVAIFNSASYNLFENNFFASTSPGRVDTHLSILQGDFNCIRNNRFIGVARARGVVLNLEADNNAFVGNLFDFRGADEQTRQIWLVSATNTVMVSNVYIDAQVVATGEILNTAPEFCPLQAP